MMKIWIVAGLLLTISPTFACINDRDTLGQEAASQKANSSGLPDVVRVITGRFERNPPLYYEMRLKRATAELKANPTKLDLYDDAAVASERLGRSKDALSWMDRKWRQLTISKLDAKSKREHLYRYYANTGTFHAHSWLRSGANRADMREMKTGREMIKRAIEIKPNAHFGREKYQLLLMEWILNPPQSVTENDYLNLKDLETYDNMDLLKSSKYSDAITGLSGLVVLGDAWNSFDVFYALKQALNAQGDTAISELARQRCLELLSDGRSSLSPNFGVKSAEDFPPLFSSVKEEDSPHALFLRLRAEAVSYQYLREAYMNDRLREGLHPDTNPDFWKEWQEPPLPSLELPNANAEQRQQTVKTIKQIGWYLLMGIVGLIGLIIGRRFPKP